MTDDDINGIRSIYATRQRNVFSNFDAAVEGEASFASKGYFFYGSVTFATTTATICPIPGTPYISRPSGTNSRRGLDFQEALTPP